MPAGSANVSEFVVFAGASAERHIFAGPRNGGMPLRRDGARRRARAADSRRPRRRRRRTFAATGASPRARDRASSRPARRSPVRVRCPSAVPAASARAQPSRRVCAAPASRGLDLELLRDAAGVRGHAEAAADDDLLGVADPRSRSAPRLRSAPTRSARRPRSRRSASRGVRAVPRSEAADYSCSQRGGRVLVAQMDAELRVVSAGAHVGVIPGFDADVEAKHYVDACVAPAGESRRVARALRGRRRRCVPTRPATAPSALRRDLPAPCSVMRSAPNPARSAVTSSPSEQTSTPIGCRARWRRNSVVAKALAAYETSAPCAAAESVSAAHRGVDDVEVDDEQRRSVSCRLVPMPGRRREEACRWRRGDVPERARRASREAPSELLHEAIDERLVRCPPRSAGTRAAPGRAAA